MFDTPARCQNADIGRGGVWRSARTQSAFYLFDRSTTDASVDAARAFTADVVQLVREKNTELSGRDLGWFVNLSNGTEKAEDVFGANLPRLRKIKAKYDPKKVWSKGFVIEPLLE